MEQSGRGPSGPGSIEKSGGPLTVDRRTGAGRDAAEPEVLPGETEATEASLEQVPVFQWDVNPEDATLVSGTAELLGDEYDYWIWWQIHPERLVYASVQGLRHDAVAERHVGHGHSVAPAAGVNLVYDQERHGIVAVYGSVRDFRPFVAAFLKVYRAASAERRAE